MVRLMLFLLVLFVRFGRIADAISHVFDFDTEIEL